MTLLGAVGDILWILALSVMAGASRVAWGKIGKDVRVPVLWTIGGATAWRAPRWLALTLLPTIAFLLSLYLLLGSREGGMSAAAVAMLGVRATLAAIFAVVHLGQVRRALNQLAAEGQIKL